jgi:glucose-1-phosphate thymidylyltransferase
MKGIILAGGFGSRLYPLTQVASKHLLPVYDKPMIYYSLSTLLFAKITDIAIICTSNDIRHYQDLLGDGESIGCKFTYLIQEKPNGISEAFIIAENFIDDESVCLILGDNIFYGDGLPKLVQKHASLTNGASVFAYPVSDPSRYGVVEFDTNHNAKSIEEKPNKPKSRFAVTGLYFYDNQVVEFAKQLKPSPRGELEITDLNKIYLEKNQLKVEVLGRGFAWLDAGTPNSLFEASQFVQVIESRQGFKIACIEEISYRMGLIDLSTFAKLSEKYTNSSYGDYMQTLVLREQACAIS